MALEVELRRREGEAPDPYDYCRRFPAFDSEYLDRAFEGQRASQPASGPPDSPPRRLGRYEVRETIGRGGMGEVYRVHDAELNRDLALKVMHAQFQCDASMRRRFIEEAQVTGQLQYPSIPPAFERGELPDGRLYYTMKLVQGHTLHELLQARPNPAHEAAHFLSIFEKVAQAVAYAHSKHVLLRDLKPSNIMVGRFGEVQVMDWGASKVLVAQARERAADISQASVVRTVRTSESYSDTQAGSAIGTYAYMPPEQAEGDVEKVDERADVFALGSILCELLTGSPAYAGRDQDEIRRKAMRGDQAEARERLDTCGAEPDLVSLAKQCLAAEPHDRLNNAGIVAGRIAAHINAVEERLEAAKLARVAAETKAAEERKRRRLAVASMAAGLLLISIAGTVVWFWLKERNDREKEARDRFRFQVAETLHGSKTLIKLGWGQTNDYGQWRTMLDKARMELDRSEGLLASGPVDAALRVKPAG